MMRYEVWSIVNNGQLWSKSPKLHTTSMFTFTFHYQLKYSKHKWQINFHFQCMVNKDHIFFPNQGWLSVESDFMNIRIKIIKMPPMFEQFHFLGIVSCSVVVCDNSWNILSPVIPVGFLH